MRGVDVVMTCFPFPIYLVHWSTKYRNLEALCMIAGCIEAFKLRDNLLQGRRIGLELFAYLDLVIA